MKTMTFFRHSSFILFLLLSSGIAAQKVKVMSHGFWGQTIDVIYWDNVEYMCGQSPLSDFEHYKTILGSLTTEKYNPEVPVELDKNYKATWIIKDKRLFLVDVEILDGSENYPDNYYDRRKLIEKLTNRKFQPDLNLFSQYPEGVMFASWFSGFIYIKRQPEPGESYCDCMYQCENFKELGFRNGRLIHEEVAFFIRDQLVDSIEIHKNPSKFVIRPNRVTRRSHCATLLREKLSLEEHMGIYESFFGTNDEILWNDTTFMCGESPLSVLDNYKNIYPNIIHAEVSEAYPRFHEKNYIAKWAIVNNRLYLYDIAFQLGRESYENYNQEYAVRLQAVEKLTGKKFQQIPSFNQKAIFAEWYSGTFYFKRFPAKGELHFNCPYRCEPFHKVTIEKGEVKSMEKTSYMILKRNN